VGVTDVRVTALATFVTRESVRFWDVATDVGIQPD
jgi:hypothetical protein